ncbi:ABC transporter substrate-binding protein [Maritalea sp. S77]|uniref:ABC transporter substrate-binding protein n=1 Tax=Maritalea sp. S77 TaxID=3415125 RepID=UPI003C7ED16F
MPKGKHDGSRRSNTAMANALEARPKIMGRNGASEQVASSQHRVDILQTVEFLDSFMDELDHAFEVYAPNPYIRMSLHLIQNHFLGKTVTPTSLIGASGVPYATANRRLSEMVERGLVDQRPRTQSGKTYSMHPSDKLLKSWMQFSERAKRLASQSFVNAEEGEGAADYYFGGSYMSAKSIPPMKILPEPLKLNGGLRVLVHGDPTFMVMESLKRQFEQVVGTPIHQRAFSIDRLREEILRNSGRKASMYDIVAVDLPWVGELVEKGVLLPLDSVLDQTRLDPADFHTAGWSAAHWNERAYAVPAQTTPELLFYRKDLFADAGIEPPVTTDEVLRAAAYFHNPTQGRYGVAWNAAKGTALGHTFLMTLADFGQPILDLPEIAGGYDASRLATEKYKLCIDTERGLAAAEYLLELLKYSPPNILSMSWFERVRPYAAGEIPMAYGYTLLAPYFEQDATSPASGKTGYLPHPSGMGAQQIAPVGGYALAIPANIAPDRLQAAAEALIVFTSPEAQKLYVQNGSLTNPRYSVASDPEVRRSSIVFEAVDGMSWRDELQFWPRPPIPQITDIIRVCGEELHDMLRGVQPAKMALQRAQERAEQIMQT